MKKIIIAIFAALLVIGGVSAIKDKFSGELAETPSPAEFNFEEQSATSTKESLSFEEKIDEVDPLKVEAMRIADEPLRVRADLSPAALASAKDNLAKTVKMIKENYDYDVPWLDLGNYRKLVGDYDGAISAWKFLSRLRPKNYVAPHNIGDLYAFTLKDYARGEEFLLKSVELSPGNVFGYLSLATLYGESSFGKTEQVEKILLRGVEAVPEDPVLKAVLAGHYCDSGDRTKAILYFEEALKLSPRNSAEIEKELNALKNAG